MWHPTFLQRAVAALLASMFAYWASLASAEEAALAPGAVLQFADSAPHSLGRETASADSENRSGMLQAEPAKRLNQADRECAAWDLEACVRGYYLNDQRIQWSGVEETFGAEAVLGPRVEHQFTEWQTCVEGEFYLNQPFDRNILVDTPERASYRGNFEITPLEISQLHLSAKHHDLSLTVGKFETPFGRTYFPLYTNARLDAPFLRTECILWRETGAKVGYQRGWFVTDVAFTNGGGDRDTNSSKALVSRAGVEAESWACGFSIKVHDGIGSEGQKQFNNHLGFDSMLRRGRFTLSGEAIYDEYGFRRPDFDPLDITWGRSIYYRDQNYRVNVPITGLGYYVDLMCDADPFTISCNFGEYYPQQLGIPQHDVTQRRGIVKGAYSATPQLQLYLSCLVETDGYRAQAERLREGWAMLAGLQWAL